jgi:hypothetical protein
MKIGKAKVKEKLSKEVLELLIDQAYDRSPHSEFVASCEDFLHENGFLSEKQIEALKNVKPSNKSFVSEDREDQLFDSYDDEEEDDCYD